jgi:hypothetical protein
MPSDFIVPSLRIQTEHQMNESDLEQVREERLLEMKDDRIQSMEDLEHEQRLREVFVDRHRKRNEQKLGIEKAVLLFQSRSGLMPDKLRLRWTGPYWILNEENGSVHYQEKW